ncbi:MAG: RQC domain protein [Candidatus Atribacteria bacterium]|nr:RQC domain protein [Candidatus Atribacteria bacterium]
MSRRRETKVRYQLDSGGIKELPFEEIKAILRGADDLISVGGRNLLAKILKGSKDKIVLSHQLENSPVYGFYHDLTLQEIMYRIDWVIENHYLNIHYNGQLPVLVYSDTGWEIERETYAEELLHKLKSLLETGDYSFVKELKDRNRGMIFLLIDKIMQTHNKKFIPLLYAWKENEYKKVRSAIQNAIHYLSKK